jgi:hypothetical protein
MGQLSHTPADLDYQDGIENPGGTNNFVYIVKRADLVAPFPKLKENSATADEYIVLDDDFTLDSGKNFAKIYITEDTGQVKDESQGERDGMSYKSTAKGLVSKITKDSLQLAQLVNFDCVVIFEQANNGERRVFGWDSKHKAMIKFTPDTGEGMVGRNGGLLEVEVQGKRPAPLYKGIIQLAGDDEPAIS